MNVFNINAIQMWTYIATISFRDNSCLRLRPEFKVIAQTHLNMSQAQPAELSLTSR